jgi:hypothetical protein
MGLAVSYILVLVLMWHYLDIRVDASNKWKLILYAIFVTMILFRFIGHIFIK